MKTVIMAGGRGKRAESIDASVPKPLLPIAGKPILQWEIDCLVSQGLNDIVLTVSHMADQIMAFFGDGKGFGCKITYYVEDEPLGNAGALFKLWEDGILEGDFLLLNADAMFDLDFYRLIDYHRSKAAYVTLLTHPNNHPQDSGLIISSPDGVVQKWLTKEEIRPKWYKNRVNAGVHVVNTELLRLSGIVPADVDASHRVDLDRDILKPSLSCGRIYAYDSPEYIKDMGTPERFEQVGRDLANGMVQARNLLRPQRAIFLDRDGTINRYVGFLRDLNDFELMDGVAEAIKKINESGYLVIVCTNQPVIARGEVTVEELDTIHNKMETLLGEYGAYIDALYYCPHHPDKGFEGEIPELKIDCDCRKPKAGMLYRAAKDFHIDLSASWMVGDGEADIKAGQNAGCRTALISNERNQGADFGQTVTVGDLTSFTKVVEINYGSW